MAAGALPAAGGVNVTASPDALHVTVALSIVRPRSSFTTAVTLVLDPTASKDTDAGANVMVAGTGGESPPHAARMAATTTATGRRMEE